MCDVLNGLLALSMAGFLFFFPEQTGTALVWLFAVNVLSSTVNSFFRPAITASIPDLVPADRVAAANSMHQASFQVSTFIGQGAGGTIFRLLGAPALFLLDGITYLFSAISESFITIPQKLMATSRDWREALHSFKHDTIEGFHYVWKKVGLRSLVLMATIVNFFFSPLMVLFPFYVEDFLNATPDWFGFLLAASGLGSLIGYTVAGAVKLSGSKRCFWMLITLLGIGTAIGILSLLSTPITALLVMLVVGIMSGFFNINTVTILQVTTPSEIRGRVFGLLGTLSMGLMPVGLGLAGVVADWVDHNISAIFAASGMIVLVTTVYFAFQREFRTFLVPLQLISPI